jgi:hypothetical protein
MTGIPYRTWLWTMQVHADTEIAHIDAIEARIDAIEADVGQHIKHLEHRSDQLELQGVPEVTPPIHGRCVCAACEEIKRFLETRSTSIDASATDTVECHKQLDLYEEVTGHRPRDDYRSWRDEFINQEGPQAQFAFERMLHHVTATTRTPQLDPPDQKPAPAPQRRILLPSCLLALFLTTLTVGPNLGAAFQPYVQALVVLLVLLIAYTTRPRRRR